jgi:phospho-N-acetylmuramoyl-pentapeptide-transferase
VRLPLEGQVVLFFIGVAALTVWAGSRLIPLLGRFAVRQHAYEDAPATHAVKTGTPTMGGLLFVLALLIALLAIWSNSVTIALVVLGLGCGAIGLLDDYLSIRRGRNRGLRARTKLLLTAVVAVFFLWLARGAILENVPTNWDGAYRMFVLPGVWWHASWLAWGAVGFVVILATTHAVNLTDGLDGLLGGSMLSPLAVLVAIATTYAFIPGTLFGAQPHALQGIGLAVIVVDIAVGAAVLGFLYYNVHPARLFMGDTGSLALGGILAGSAILLGMQFLLIVIGGVFVAETLSVILQVASFKLTGKRIFRMSPLHHHFELAGWPEEKVTLRFWAASALCSAAGVALYLVRP